MTARPARPALLARQALTDATVTATLVDAALHALDLGLAGWPEQTPGASPASSSGLGVCRHPECTETAPCGQHDPDATQRLTATERLGTSPDTARRDLEILNHAIRSAARALTITATICHRWGLEGVTVAEVKEGLKERIEDMWCANCALAGLSTVTLIGRRECSFCQKFRLEGACMLKNPNGFPCPKGLLDIHVTGRKLRPSDVVRVMTDVHGPNWNRKINKKGKVRAA